MGTRPVTQSISAVSGDLPVLSPSSLALFLDFDGTLAPIASRPEQAVMSPATRATVERLARATDGALAVVSGRTLDSLDALLTPLALPAAGSHGLERRSADGRLHRMATPPSALAAIEAVVAFGRERSLLVERKPSGASVHYRARPEFEAECRAFVDRTAAAPGLRTVHGKMIAELSIDLADKGDAVDAFMAEAPFAGRMPFAAGDDVTDEDAFRVAVALGGVAVKIGDGPTVASHRAATIEDFLAWLGRLAAEERF